MNTLLRLQLQIVIKNAQAISQTQSQVKGLGATAKAAGQAIDKSFMGRMEQWSTGIINWGKQIQWTGRQIEFSFTMPMVRAAKAVAAYALENEKAITKMAKVYDTGGDSVDKFSSTFVEMGERLQTVNRAAMTPLQQESYDLGRAFRALSDEFGVNQAKVSDLGAMWAATGLKGTNLAKAVRLTMESMVVGDFTDQEQAFKTLIQVQQAYGLNMEELRAAMALMNTTENITAAQFADLADVVARSGGAAREAGIDLRHLVAMASALVPATGSASTAGNSLKTIISKIVAPTQDAIDVLNKMGIAFDDSAFQAMNVGERLEFMAEKFKALDQGQKSVVASFVAGRYQLNRFDVLMDNLADSTGSYRKVLEATSGDLSRNGKVQQEYNDEIQTYLKSTPQGIEIIKTRIMNTANSILVDLTPAIFMFLKLVMRLVSWFNHLGDGTKHFVLLTAVIVAGTGPVLRYIGAFTQLIGTFYKFIRWSAGVIAKLFEVGAAEVASAATTAEAEAAKAVAYEGAATAATTAATAEVAAAGLSVGAMVGIAAAVAALIAVIVVFRKEIWGAIQWVGDKIRDFSVNLAGWIASAWRAVVNVIGTALSGIVRIIERAVRAAWHWLSYLNPFARHSPSLVDQVIAGVDLIAKKYASLSNIGSVFRRAISDLEAFKAASADAIAAAGASERGKQRANIAEFAPGALGQFDQLSGTYDEMVSAMAQIKAEMNDQQAAVDEAQAAYDALDKAVEAADDQLKLLQKTASKLNDQLSAAKDELEHYASAPIVGMKAMEDAIFGNEMAQKKLRLEMMKLEDVVGPLDDIKDRMAMLQGDIETLQGMQADLRAGGAGSEITGPIQAQIDAFEAQRTAIEDQAKPLEEMDNQLKALARSAEEMDLEKSLKFDPLTRQVDELAHHIDELPFDVIIAGVSTSKAKVDELTKAYDQANFAVEQQQAVVDALNTSRDAAKAKLDDEKATLEALDKVYSDFEDQLHAIEDAMKTLDSAVGTLKQDLADSQSLAEDLFDAAQDFEPGDLGAKLDLPSDEDLQKMVDDWLKNLDMGDFDPFAGIKKKISGFWNWWTGFWESYGGHVADDWFAIAGAIDTAWEWIKSSVKKAWDWVYEKIKGAVEKVGKWLDGAWEWIKKAPGRAWDWITDEASKLPGRIIGALGDLGSTIWNAIWGTLSWFLDQWGKWVGSVLDFIFGMPGKILYGLGFALGTIVYLFVQLPGWIWDAMGDIGAWLWDKAKKGWDDFKEETRKILDAVIDFFKKLPGRVWNALGDIGTWLWDQVKAGWENFKVGTAIILDAVVDFFVKLPGRVWNGLGDLGRWLWGLLWGGFHFMKEQVGVVIDEVVGFFTALPGRIGQAAIDIYNAARDIGGKIWSGITAGVGVVGDIAGSIGRALLGFVNDTVIGGIESGINFFIDGWNNSWGGHLHTFGHVHLPRIWGSTGGYEMPPGVANETAMPLATGGYVPGAFGTPVPTILHGGEYVIGLEAMRALRAAGGSLPGVARTFSLAPSADSGTTILNFHGDLSFPNVTDGDDAKAFISNLESLAV